VDFEKHTDILRDYCKVEMTNVGCILDAQDQYGTWHLGVVLDTKN